MAVIPVYVAPDEFSAISLRDMLAQHGVSSVLVANEIAGWILPPVSASYSCWGAIMVEEELQERATELIHGFLGTLGELSEVSDEELEEYIEENEMPQDDLDNR